MRNSLIAAVLFGGFLAETALPVAPQTQKQTNEPAAPVTAAPQTQKKQIQKSSPSSVLEDVFAELILLFCCRSRSSCSCLIKAF
jgi:hypothetical protein